MGFSKIESLLRVERLKYKYDFSQCENSDETDYLNLVEDYKYLKSLLSLAEAVTKEGNSLKGSDREFVKDIYEEYLKKKPNIALLRERGVNLSNREELYSLGDFCIDINASELLKTIFANGGAKVEDLSGNNLAMRCVKRGMPEIAKFAMIDKNVRRHTNNNGENISLIALDKVVNEYIEDNLPYLYLAKVGAKDEVMSVQQEQANGYNIGMKCASLLHNNLSHYRVRAQVRELYRISLKNVDASRQKDNCGRTILDMETLPNVKFKHRESEMEM